MLTDYRLFLKEEWEKRKRRNPLFSLRSFADFIGISPAQLSQILSGKRPLGLKHAQKIAQKLNLSPQERTDLFESINPLLAEKKKKFLEDKNHFHLEEDQFKTISDWHHYAILSLCEVAGFVNQARWISKKIQVPLPLVREALDRLLRLGLLKEEDGRLLPTHQALNTTQDISSSSIRRYHKQNLELAAEKIETVSLEERDFSSITFSGNKEKIKEVKMLIKEFKRKICEVMQEGGKGEVYTLAVQIFPLTIKGN